MSSLGQFIGKPYPIGTTISIEYDSDLFTAPDGTVWYALTQTAPFPYNENYAGLPDFMYSTGSILNAPDGDSWKIIGVGNYISMAYRPSPTLYVTSAVEWDAINANYYYYTSTDGNTWTKRLWPYNKVYYSVEYIAASNLFFAVSISSTTNGVLTSSDGINWTPYTSVSVASCQDIVANGINNLITYPVNTTTGGMYSLDGGATWAAYTLPYGAGAGFGTNTNGLGAITWNTGAGLFIGTSILAGLYQTSSNGMTWTARSFTTNTAITFNLSGSSVKVASSPTTTVAMGYMGFYATTTDGITWSDFKYIIPPGDIAIPAQGPSSLYYDGARFVATYNHRVFYSTDGTSWTEGKSIGSIASYRTQSNGVLFGQVGSNFSYPFKMIKVDNVASTTANTIFPPIGHTIAAIVVNYIRIR